MFIRYALSLVFLAPALVACTGSDEATVEREAAFPTTLTHCIQNDTKAPFNALVSNSAKSSLTIAPGARACAESFTAPRDVNISFTMSRVETPETSWSLKSRLTLSTYNQFGVHACGYDRWNGYNEDVLDCGGEKLTIKSWVQWDRRSVDTVIATA